jgi:hypothetical protein
MTWAFSWVDPQIRFENYDNNYFYFYADSGQLDLRPKSGLVTQVLPWIESQVGF